MGRRVLITGLDTFWGGRMAQALEAEPDVEMILGLGANEPRVPLERTEFVRSDQKYSILNRIVRATQVDTIVHTFLETNSVNVSSRALHEINVIGTLNLLAAAGTAGHLGPPGGGQVLDPRLRGGGDRPRLVPRGGPSAPARSAPGWSARSSRWSRWSGTSPRTIPTWWSSVLRFANVLGTDIITPISHDLRRRLLPCIAGFDPLVQFVEEDDVVRALEYVTAQPDPRGVQRGRGGQAALERGGLHRRRLPPAAPAVPAPGSSSRPLRRARHRAVPARDGGPGPLRAGRRHLPAASRPGSSTATPAPGRWRASPGPTTCAGPPGPATPSTATSRTSSSSSGTHPRRACADG